MGRPRTEDQYRAAFRLFLETEPTLGPTAIWRRLAEDFEKTDLVALRTVKAWMKEFRDRRRLDGPLDQLFSWRLIEDRQNELVDLSWDASPFVLGAWAWYLETPSIEDPKPPLSFRQVVWWWRVHLAAPDVNVEDAYWLAQRYVVREQARIYLSDTGGTEDLDTQLAYRPWSDRGLHGMYHRAVREGRIKPINIESDWMFRSQLKKGGIKSRVPGFRSHHPELLETQQQFMLPLLLDEDRSQVEALDVMFDADYLSEDWPTDSKKFSLYLEV